jgi:hypothetical protein
MKIIITEQQNEQLNRKIRFAVEKLGLAQARQIFGDEIIKQAYMDNPESFLEQFDDLKTIKKGGRVFYHDNENILIRYWEDDYKNNDGLMMFSFVYIWSFFSGIMGYSNTEIQNLLKKWIKKTYKLTRLVPMAFNDIQGAKINDQ